ncbi:LysM peptidoglycan-binding domain-containing protein [bacterium]|nr:LysM peptidoglycan-binding domain-containing protein [bacterium]
MTTSVGQKFTVNLPNKPPVEVVAPEKPKTEDKAIAKGDFVDQQLAQAKNLNADQKVKEKAAFEQIFDKADKDVSGKIDLSEFDSLVKGIAVHQLDNEAKAVLDGTTIAEPNEKALMKGDQAAIEQAKKVNEEALAKAETAIANIPKDDPERGTYEKRLQELQSSFKGIYGDRANPPQDAGKTWGGPDSKRDLNFGHDEKPDANGTPQLTRMSSTGKLLWADSDTAVTSDQWANMPKAQQEKILSSVPEDQREALNASMATGDASKAKTSGPATETVTVKAGDTLSKIARANGVTLDEIKQANPDLFQDGKDATGKRRTSGGALIYPGDQITIPGKAQEAAPAASAPEEEATVTESKPEETAPKPSEQAAHGYELLEAATKDPEAAKKWSAQDKADVVAYTREVGAEQMAVANDKTKSVSERVEAIQQAEGTIQVLAQVADAAGLPEVAKEAQMMYGELKVDDGLKQVVADQVKATQEKAGKVAGHAVDIRFDGNLAPLDQLKQLEVLDKQLDDPNNAALWKGYNAIEFNTYTSATNSKDPNNLSRFVESDGKVLKINNASDDGLTASEIDKQSRAIAQAGAEAKVEAHTASVEEQLSKKAGHPVKVDFNDKLSAEDREKELALLDGMLQDSRYDAVWQKFSTVEFNTYESAKNSEDPDNLSHFVETSGKTLKINNAAKDGITASELDKQQRAMEYYRDRGRTA